MLPLCRAVVKFCSTNRLFALKIYMNRKKARKTHPKYYQKCQKIFIKVSHIFSRPDNQSLDKRGSDNLISTVLHLITNMQLQISLPLAKFYLERNLLAMITFYMTTCYKTLVIIMMPASSIKKCPLRVYRDCFCHAFLSSTKQCNIVYNNRV